MQRRWLFFVATLVPAGATTGTKSTIETTTSSREPADPRESERLRKQAGAPQPHAAHGHVPQGLQHLHGERVAILVAGTFDRYFLSSTCENLISPLTRQGHEVDYFLALTTKPPLWWRGYGHANTTWDPAFRLGQNKRPSFKHIKQVVNSSVAAANSTLRYFRLSYDLTVRGEPRLEAALNESYWPALNGSGHNEMAEDPFIRWPLLAYSMSAHRKAANQANALALKAASVANHNILCLFRSLELLWEQLLVTEEKSNSSYTLVLVPRDDADWLQKLDLHRLLSESTDADGYGLSCDIRQPLLQPSEQCDHVLLLRRRVAEFIGRYYNTTLLSMAWSCRVGIGSSTVPCNSEQVLRWRLQMAGIRLHNVGQGLLPLQRSARLLVPFAKEDVVCYHKFCQSARSPLLGLPKRPQCKDIRFSHSQMVALKHRDERGDVQRAQQDRLALTSASAPVDYAESSRICTSPCHKVTRRMCPAESLQQPQTKYLSRFHCDGTCGFCDGANSTVYLNGLIQTLERHHATCKVVNYAVAFGTGTKQLKSILGRMLNFTTFLLPHRECFFFFVLAGDGLEKILPQQLQLSTGGSLFTVAVDANVLGMDMPFMQLRRIVKLFKLLGHRIFPWAQVLVWVDLKLISTQWTRDFTTYMARKRALMMALSAAHACAAFVGLPKSVNSFGPEANKLPPSALNLTLHAHAIIASAAHRSSTDSVNIVQQQLHAYHSSPDFVDNGMSTNLIDSAFFIRDHTHAYCRTTSASLGCKWYDETMCYSDRDQMSFPMTIHALGWRLLPGTQTTSLPKTGSSLIPFMDSAE